MHHTELVPRNVEHNLDTVNIWSGRRREGMSGSQCDKNTVSDSVFEAAVHNQRNAVQHLSASTRTETNFLATELFQWLWGVHRKYLRHSMSLRHSFLQVKVENQNFPKKTRIWLENWDLRSRINLSYKHKSTSMVLSLSWQMSKLIAWYFLSAYFDQHLPLHPSFVKRRQQSCTPNILRNHFHDF